MRIVLTNDDGFDAPGLAALWQAVDALGDVSVTVVAPLHTHSGCGHVFSERLLLHTNEVPTIGKVHVVDGSPADCVCAAVHHPRLAAPQWVIAGINAGGNLGVDIYPSGTVAAARQAAIFGIPAIAVSQLVVAGQPVDWQRATREAASVLAALVRPDEPPPPHADPDLHRLARQAVTEAPPWPEGTPPCWNVNLPYLPDGQAASHVRLAPISRDAVHLDYTMTDLEDGSQLLDYVGKYHDRPAGRGTDVEVTFGGAISLSQVPI